MIYLLFFVGGAAVGIGGAYAYFDAWRIWMRDEAKKWEDWRMREVKELRAQVARHIGANATPVDQSTVGHSARAVAQAERPHTA